MDSPEMPKFSYDTVMKWASTPIQGGFQVWHLAVFLTLGPMITWPMLVVLMIVFGQNIFGMLSKYLPTRS